ncbi:hypothetical protein MTO96_008634 [Rhipicephalus appendiculatus]
MLEAAENTCDETRLAASLRQCDAKVHPTSMRGSDLSVVADCSAVRDYKACLAELTRVDGCGNASLLVQRQQEMYKFLQEHPVCVEHANVSSQIVAETLLSKSAACSRQDVWNAQFLCAKTFQDEVYEIRERTGGLSEEVCGSIIAAWTLWFTRDPARGDAELGEQAEYFRNVLTSKYSDLCPEELGLPASRRRVSSKLVAETLLSKSAACSMHDVWNAQFMCAKTFHDEVDEIRERSGGLSKEVCESVKLYYSCLDAVVHEGPCKEDAELGEQAKYFRNVLTYKYSDLCSEELGLPASRRRVSSKLVAETLLSKSAACSVQDVWNAQFMCAKTFHAEVDEIRERSGGLSKEVCGSVKLYYSCLDAVVHEGPCKGDAELGEQAEYFRNVLTYKYSDLCPEELGLPASRRGVRNPPKERICTAYKNMERCTRDLQCASATSTFNFLSMRVLDELLSPFDKYCRGFVGPGVSNRTVPPPPPPTPAPTCNEDLYLQKYFECGLMYMFNLPGANETDYEKRTNLVCERAWSTQGRLPTARTEFPFQKNLDYFDNELHTVPQEKCSALAAKRAARRRFRSSVPRCHIREYAGTYFTCGVVFLAATYPDQPPADELCRLLSEFKKCVAGLVPCRTGSDITVQLNAFTRVLTEGYNEPCKNKNISGFCDKFILLKDYFSCSLTYYQSYDEFGQSYLLTKQHSCKLLEDYGRCTYEKVLKNACESLKALFSNIRDVRNYIAKLFNQRHQVSCSIPSDMQRQRGPVSALQTSCDEFAAIENASSALVEVDNSSTDALCSLLKEMKFCIYSAVKDSGCSESLFFNTEVSLLRRRLLAEFEGDCDDTLSSGGNSSGAAKNRQGCELKEFTQEWETCEADRAHEVDHKYRNGTGLQDGATTRDLQRNRFCSDIPGYLQCLRDSAGRHHCPALAPGSPNTGNEEWFRRLGFLACSSSPSLPLLGSGWALKLLALVGAARAVAFHSAPW